ncbi:hypothetical protein [Sporosarcina sp. A2]|uniref:hypothetical protein n=1 Tax=Sporosarcina sp. A2 TaxID=3393449 RepID=UPI003D7B49E8
MAIAIGYLITILGVFTAYQFSEGRSKKQKYKVWGIALMLPISPSIAFSIGHTYAAIVRDGWSVLIMFYIFPVIFLIGLIMLLVGFFMKEGQVHTHSDLQ